MRGEESIGVPTVRGSAVDQRRAVHQGKQSQSSDKDMLMTQPSHFAILLSILVVGAALAEPR
jgi:hypothetical protein